MSLLVAIPNTLMLLATPVADPAAALDFFRNSPFLGPAAILALYGSLAAGPSLFAPLRTPIVDLDTALYTTPLHTYHSRPRERLSPSSRRTAQPPTLFSSSHAVTGTPDPPTGPVDAGPSTIELTLSVRFENLN